MRRLARRSESARTREVGEDLQQDVDCLRGAFGWQPPDAHAFEYGVVHVACGAYVRSLHVVGERAGGRD